MSEPVEKRQKPSPPGEPRGAGAGSGAGADTPATTYRAPTQAEMKEIRELILSKTTTADDMLAWLQSHPDVRADWMWDGKGKLKEPEATFFKKNHAASFLGQIFVGPRKIPLEHPLVQEVIRRKPDLTQKDVYRRTLAERLEGEIAMSNDGAMAVNTKPMDEKLAFLENFESGKQGLRGLYALQAESVKMGIPEDVQGELGKMMAPVTSGVPAKQFNEARKSLGLQSGGKGGRRTVKRKSSKRRQTRRRR